MQQKARSQKTLSRLALLGLGLLAIALCFVAPSQALTLKSGVEKHVTLKDERGIIGLDMEIRPGQSYPLVKRVFPGSPADISGLKAGDLIMAIDGRSTWSLSRSSVDRAFSEQPGTTHQLLVARGIMVKGPIPLTVMALSKAPSSLQSFYSAF